MSAQTECPGCGGVVVLGEPCPRCLLRLAFVEATASDASRHAAVREDMPSPSGWNIDHYTPIKVLGEGGMGVVYEAEQHHPRRVVALKVIKPGWTSAEVLRRFEKETEALARLQHAGIAQIHEAGMVDTGHGKQPFFAMELIRGKPLGEYAREHRLNTRQRLELTAKICDAVHHAHQRGIIHRDLKPGNILVDESGQPKILDFGVARVTDSDARATRQTDVGHIVGTLAYMSPEQVLADPHELDSRSDVYALGVILYELLAERLPYAISKDLPEAVRTIREEDPAPLTTTNRRYRGDVETIVGRALEKDKARRYPSAADLRDDILRYLADRPIVARPPSVSYQLHKFARRHKGLVASVAAVIVILLVGIVLTAREARRARQAEQVAKAISDFLQHDLLDQASSISQGQPGTKPDPDIKVRTVLDRAASRIQNKFAGQPHVEAAIRHTMGNTYLDLGLYDEAQNQLERGLDIRKRIFGSEHPDTLSAMNDLAHLYLDYQGKPAQAEPLLTNVLEVRRRVLGELHADTLISVSNLGALYRSQGRYAQAEAMFRELVDTRGRVLGEEHPDTLLTMYDLAWVFRRQNRYADAERLYLRVIEARRRVLGDDHSDTLITMNNLALVYQDQGKYAEAEPLLTAVVASWRKGWGEEHAYTLTGMNNLGRLYLAEQKYAEAELMLTQVLVVRRRVLGEEHASTMVTTSNLASLYREQGRYEDAEALFSKVVELSERNLGKSHPDTLSGLSNLARVYLNQGKYTRAEAVLRDALANYPDALANTFNRAHARSLLGASLCGQRRHSDAEPLLLSGYENMLRTQAATPAYNRPRIEEAGMWIVGLYEGWDSPERAAEWLRKISEDKATAVLSTTVSAAAPQALRP